MKFGKGSEIDDITVEMLKFGGDYVPVDWIKANMIPLYKGGDNTHMET